MVHSKTPGFFQFLYSLLFLMFRFLTFVTFSTVHTSSSAAGSLSISWHFVSFCGVPALHVCYCVESSFPHTLIMQNIIRCTLMLMLISGLISRKRSSLSVKNTPHSTYPNLIPRRPPARLAASPQPVSLPFSVAFLRSLPN